MSSIRTIIVDDEPHARRYLSELLAVDDDVDVVAELKNGREALDYLELNEVDLVFLDIHMPGINGLEVMERLPEDNKPIIVFTTAYNQYAIAAFEATALDYLLKPFDKQRLIKSVKRVKQLLNLREQSGFHQKMIRLYEEFQDSKSSKLTEFIIKERGFEKVIKTKDIKWISSNSVYVELHTTSQKYLYRAALNLLANELPEQFLRIHRSVIINTVHIEKTTYLNNNTYKFQMSNGVDLISSRSYKSSIMTKLPRH